MKYSHRCFSLKRQNSVDPFLSEDIDLTDSKLRVICAHGKEALDWVISNDRGLRVDAITIDLSMH